MRADGLDGLGGPTTNRSSDPQSGWGSDRLPEVLSSARLADIVAQMDQMIQERVTQKENELNAEYDERLRNYEER